jgi:ribosomal protein S9
VKKWKWKNQLKNSGALTKDEFEVEKKKILGQKRITN